MSKKQFSTPPTWTGTSEDPNDQQFGDVIEPTTWDDAESYDILLVGEPYDGAVLGRPGAREGPGALRDHLAETKSVDLSNSPIPSIGDLGDINIQSGESVRKTHESIREVTKRIHDLDAFPVFLGGDHSVSFPNAAPLLTEHESVGVINFDAHADVREANPNPSNGSPFRQLFDEGLEEYVLIGARPFETSSSYLDFLSEKDAQIISAKKAGTNPVEAIDSIQETMSGVEAVYVSCDIDVLDMMSAPGSTAPTPGGFSTRELYVLLDKVVSEKKIRGFDFIGCAPSLDPGDNSAKAGSRAIAHFINALNKNGVR